jgi:selenide, water dikinase
VKHGRYDGSTVDTRTEPVRLTTLSHGAGCACKLPATDLAIVLEGLGPASFPPEVLVSPATGDDAAVVVLPGGQAIVQTLDFFTPIVDDPYDWGRIAATNALSDVYAMGGRPLTALNIVAWPVDVLSLDLLGRVLAGGAEVAGRAGVSIVGGHSITDPEPKYGMAVTGLVDPDRIVRNSAMRPGDRLYLTKALGTGIIATAVKRGVHQAHQLEAAVRSMTTLNASGAEAMLEAGVVAATDVTGFGLLGHLHVALRGSGCAATVDARAVPLLAGAFDLAADGVVPGGTRSNHRFVAPHVDWGETSEVEQLLLVDAQTSGGLLIAVAEESEQVLRSALEAREIPTVRVGTVSAGAPGRITVSGRLAA